MPFICFLPLNANRPPTEASFSIFQRASLPALFTGTSCILTVHACCPGQQRYMRSFGRPSGPSRPAAPVTWVTGHRIMRDNVLHPHFQSSRFNPSFRWSSSLVRTFFRPPWARSAYLPSPCKIAFMATISPSGHVVVRPPLLLPLLATRTIFPAPCAHPTKDRSCAPTRRITRPLVIPLSDSEKREKTPNTAQYNKKQ